MILVVDKDLIVAVEAPTRNYKSKSIGWRMTQEERFAKVVWATQCAEIQ